MSRFYVGTYTGPNSRGIYLVDLDPATGALSAPVLAGETKNPSFLALHPTQPYLYAALEVGEFEGQKTGAVQAFRIDRGSGMLQALNSVSSRGPGPCFVSVHPTGKHAMVANYGGGNVSVLPVADDGSLRDASGFDQHAGSGPDSSRQQRAFAHSIVPDPTGRYLLSADLGTDEILVYRIDPTGAIQRTGAAKLAPGAGPRHIAFHPNGRFAFVNGEMGGTVTPFSWDGQAGALRPHAPARTLPASHKDKPSTAEVTVHPNGRFVYCSNRGHDSIATFAFDEQTATLTPIAHTPTQGQQPRHFAIDPTGKFIVAANQKSDNLVSFRIDPTTGGLAPTGSAVTVGAPCCVRFVLG